jgi:hypothetical protein
MNLSRSPVAPSIELISNSVEVFRTALTRLEEILKDENAVLESNNRTSHEPFIIKKNQILRELMIFQRSEVKDQVLMEVSADIQKLRKLVEKNHTLLHSQVLAMTEVTSILTEVALAEDADGTYSRARQ